MEDMSKIKEKKTTKKTTVLNLTQLRKNTRKRPDEKKPEKNNRNLVIEKYQLFQLPIQPERRLPYV